MTSLLPAHRARVFIGILVVAVVLTAHLLPVRGGDEYFVGTVFDIGHVLGFAALAGLVVYALRRRPRTANRYLPYVGAGLLVAGLAVLAEAAQYPTARDASMGDIARDLSGIAAGLLFASAVELRAARRLAAAALASLLVAVALFAPGAILATRIAVLLQPTTTFGFDAEFERRLLEEESALVDIVAAPADWPGGGHVLRVRPRGRVMHEGFAFYGFPRDWTKFTALRFTAAIHTEKPGAVMVRIEEGKSTLGASRGPRFRGTYPVGREPQEIVISLEEVRRSRPRRPLDLTDVVKIILTTEDAAHSELFVDDLRLE